MCISGYGVKWVHSRDSTGGKDEGVIKADGATRV